MTCEELKAKLNAQKAALLKIEARERRFSADNGSYLYAQFLEAKAEYERALRNLASIKGGVRG